MSARGLWGGPRQLVAVLFIIAGGVLLVPAAKADTPLFPGGTPPNVTQQATGPTTVVTWTDPSATDDNANPAPVSCVPASGSSFPVGTTPVTCTATDPVDSSTAQVGFNVIVQDVTPPTISLGGSQFNASATGPAGAIVDYSSFVSASDAVDPSPSLMCTPASGTPFPLGVTPVNCSATDASNNASAASFNVVVSDTTPPVISSPPANISTTATGATTPVTYTAPTATDNVDGTDPVTCVPASGSGFSTGTTTVTCDAHDSAGNPATSVSFTVTVADNVAPVITNVPSNINASATGPSTSVSYSLPTATDNVDGSVPVNCTPAPGSGFSIGQTTVNCSASDSSHNTSNASFTVTVSDTTAPVLSLPGSQTAEATSASGAPVSFSATASDNVDPSPSVSCTPASGSQFALGPTTVHCNATDASHNSSSGTFTVTVVDTTPPAFSNVPSGLNVEANGPGGSKVNYTAPGASDLVDGPVPVLCSPAAGSNFPLGATTVTCAASDSRGNRRLVSFAVHVVDTTPPTIAVPAPITVYTTSAAGCLLPCPPVSSWANSATAGDLVDPSPKITTTGLEDLIPIGVNTVNFVATDASGNRVSKTSTVTVVYDASGTVKPPVVPPKVTPPPNVTGISAKVGNSFVALTWANPKAASFDHVVVYRSLPTDSGVGTAIYTGSASTFRDTGLENDTQYRYVVVSFDKAGNQSAGVAILATPAVPKLLTPLDGAVVKRPPVLKWAGVGGANYFNVQVYMDTQLTLSSEFATNAVRVLSAWPTKAQLALHKKWRYNKRMYRLKRGIYRWFVWPGYGARSANKYGPLLGQSVFVVH